MIFLFNSSGTTLSVTPEKVYQGSNKANTVYFLCPTHKDNLVSVAFTLPSGTSLPKSPMAFCNEATGFVDAVGRRVNAWVYEIPSVVTEKSGVVTVQFFITEGDGTLVSTQSSQFFVEVGVPVVEPEPETYQNLLDAFRAFKTEMQERVAGCEENLQQTSENLTTEVQTTVSELREDVQTSLSEMDTRFNNQNIALGERIQNCQDGITTLVGNIDTINSTLESINGGLQHCEEKVELLETKASNCESGKLDKATEESEFAKAYVKTATGEQTMLDVTEKVNSGTIASRDSSGHIHVNTPTSNLLKYNTVAANKGYVDSINRKQHNVRLKGSNFDVVFAISSAHFDDYFDLADVYYSLGMLYYIAANGYYKRSETEKYKIFSVSLEFYQTDGFISFLCYDDNYTTREFNIRNEEVTSVYDCVYR